MRTIRLRAKYQQDPQLFYKDRVSAPNTLLLESAEIVTKTGKQSLIGAHCALKLSCNDLKVTVTAMNENGRPLLDALQESLGRGQRQQDQLSIAYERLRGNTDEMTRLKAPGPLDVLRALRQIVEPCTGILFSGIIAFDFINNFEDIGKVPQGPNSCPDYCFYLFDISVIINHINKTCQVNAFAFNDKSYRALEKQAFDLKNQLDSFNEVQELSTTLPEKLDYQADLNDDEFSAIIEKIKEHIVNGDAFQVVPSRTFSMPCPNPLRAYAYLKKMNPSPYMFYINDEHFSLFGSSPEFAVKFDATDRSVAISPIAGTRARGTDGHGHIDPDLDARIELELRTDRKEVAEHLMLVDLARNDLARIAVPSTREASNLLHVDRYQSVMHLVSDVTATLRDDLDALHAYQACMNMGTLSGAPKIMAHQLIYKYEGKKRGSYGGVVATLDSDGSFDSCINIRTAFVKQGTAYVQAGCGVVYDSNPHNECQETRNKARSVLTAIAMADAEQE